MGYNNNYNNNNNYKKNNYSQNGSQNQNKEQFKKSGAVYSPIKKGKFVGAVAVNAWRKTKAGLMTAKCFPISDVLHENSSKTKSYLRYAVEISNSSTGFSKTYFCLFGVESKKIVINELSLVISPNGSGYTASGKRVSGFFGANFKRR